MLLNRRGFMLKAGAGALGAAAVAGPLANRAPAGDFMYPWGLDISHWQGTVNWAAMTGAGLQFCIVKATEGTGYRDPQFSRNWSMMRTYWCFRGAYHFARPNLNAVTQARFFHSTVNPRPGDFQLVLDLEVTGGLGPAALWSWTQAFNAEIRRLTGRSCIVYTSPSFWTSRVGNPTSNLGMPLWIAHWGVGRPTVPRAWSTWSFWQWTSSGAWPGTTGRIDMDTFNGTYRQMWGLTYP